MVFDHLGDIYKALNNMDGAREYWSKALQIDPENEKIKAKLGDNETP